MIFTCGQIKNRLSIHKCTSAIIFWAADIIECLNGYYWVSEQRLFNVLMEILVSKQRLLSVWKDIIKYLVRYWISKVSLLE